MKILHVYKEYFPVLGGVENHIRWQAEGMVARGHQVQVLVTSPNRHFQQDLIDGVDVIRTGRQFNLSSAPVSLPMLAHLARLGSEADIIHLHSPYPPAELSQLLLSSGRRTVVTYHSDIVKQASLLRFYAPFLRRFLARADAILVSSPAYVRSSAFLRPLAKWESDFRLRAGGPVHVVHFGIDLDRFAPTPATLARAAELRNGFGPGPLLLFVGRLRYYKGVDVLVRALARTPKVRLILGGTGPEGERIHRLVGELGIGDRVHLLGNVPEEDLAALYRAADVFVLPSVHRSESLGIVLLEAMASGLPLISTELGTGTSYVNQTGHTGLVVPPGDVDGLSRAILDLSGDQERRRRMGSAAEERAQSTFGLESMLDRTEMIYRNLLARDN